MPTPLAVQNHAPVETPTEGARLGLVRADGIRVDRYPEGFDDALAEAIAAERAGTPSLGAAAETRRLAARDMLRFGRYKPTGRGKPASEYIARAAAEDAFPRINAPVDINNLISLEERLPISLWDLDRAGGDPVRFRAGGPEEAYVFNAGGQVLALADLLVGSRVTEAGSEPFLSPIKDAHATKTSGETQRVAAGIYAPANVVSREMLVSICERFARWLEGCGEHVATAVAVAEPGEEVWM